jgi:membrane associated rhomboid family serine protease
LFPLRDTIPGLYPPVMLWALVACNVLVFMLESALPRDTVAAVFQVFGLVPARIVHGETLALLSLLSSQFLHGSLLHVAGNLWTLWIFGDNVEDRMGPLRFLCFYLLCGVVAGMTQVLLHPGSTMPTVGASGAIAGVLGAYLVLFPHARVITLVPVLFYPLLIDLPAVTFLLFWFLTQLLSGTMALVGPRQLGGVAWWAHVGGFLTGIMLHRLFLNPRRYHPIPPHALGFDGLWHSGR